MLLLNLFVGKIYIRTRVHNAFAHSFIFRPGLADFFKARRLYDECSLRYARNSSVRELQLARTHRTLSHAM